MLDRRALDTTRRLGQQSQTQAAARRGELAQALAAHVEAIKARHLAEQKLASSYDDWTHMLETRFACDDIRRLANLIGAQERRLNVTRENETLARGREAEAWRHLSLAHARTKAIERRAKRLQTKIAGRREEAALAALETTFAYHAVRS